MKRQTNKFVSLLLCALVLLGSGAWAQKPAAKKASTLKSSGYAPVNGLKLYYEVHGAGKPLVLIHGAYMTIDLNYGEMIPQLAKSRKVIALELQGHGRTADVDRPFSNAAMADDVHALLQYLKIDSAEVLGYSMGATVALETAIRHPESVSKLVFISSVFRYEGWIKEARDVFPTMKPEFLENTPLKTEYDRLSPDKTHWKTFVEKMTEFDSKSFDLGAANIKALKCPVLIIKGDNDGVELSHISEMYQLLGGGVFGDMTGLPKSRLAIIPGTTHVTLMMQTKTLLEFIQPFLGK